MSRSQYLRRVLHRDQNPVSARVFEEQAGSLFLSPNTPDQGIDVYSLDPALSEITNSNEYMQDDRVSHSRSIIDDSIEIQDKKVDSLKSQGILQPPKGPGDTILSLRTKEDLKQYVAAAKGFQAFFIRQRHSYSPLTITYELFETLLLEKNVSPQFRDYVLYMGEREREVEMLSFCFGEFPWIFVTPSRLAQQRIDGYASCRHEGLEFNPFEIHLLLLDTAMANWRHYLIDLAAETDQHAAQSLGASPDDQGPINMADCGERQALMILDGKLQNAAIAIKSTIENVRAHLDCHRLLREGVSEVKEPAGGFIVSDLMEQLKELDTLVLRVDALRARLQGITSLVSSFLELNNGFALQSLAKDSGRENEEMRKLSERMHALTEKGTQDAAAIKVLTILTLIYLPATVVSNFFSTSFVNLQTSPGMSNHVVVSGDWWIFVAASVPLTLLTLYTWWVEEAVLLVQGLAQYNLERKYDLRPICPEYGLEK
ncbi:hypothetical protein EPUS_02318 [Endocarpon pusillum Z07020]|uniref:Uncharacterized protein n=1 Tax=Endocarpon pusillum (strain Z07020 / HMAS-L-300199) TaxID=1263415 RepID=U1I3X6_ENDPU|nr:uncharacterized protein EPUS_02318 [Endocarpon pusillum Z07020]ERF76779.1 hypothetical protein EPUS_02318 [Endocarpon pusillum Z07020]